MTPKHLHRRTVPRVEKLAFVKARPELWREPRAMTRAMREAGMYAKTTRFADCVVAVTRMIEKVSTQ